MCSLGLILEEFHFGKVGTFPCLGEAQNTMMQYIPFEMLGELPALPQMSALWYFWLAAHLAGGLFSVLSFCPSKLTTQLKNRWDTATIYQDFMIYFT